MKWDTPCCKTNLNFNIGNQKYSTSYIHLFASLSHGTVINWVNKNKVPLPYFYVTLVKLIEKSNWIFV